MGGQTAEPAVPPDRASDAGRFAARANRLYSEAKTRYGATPTNTAAAWTFARACFDWAEYATNDASRSAIAREGLRACRKLAARRPALAAAHYYLGMNLGQLARTQSLGALGIVSEMEQVFQRACELDETFDYAGPDRCLGLLYLDAPGWPFSLGSRRKARTHLERAVALSPDYPENRLNLLEACLRWEERAGAQREFETTAQLLPRARVAFAGEEWEAAWADWEKRWQAVEARMKAAPTATRPDDKAR